MAGEPRSPLPDDALRLQLALFIARPGTRALTYSKDGSNKAGPRESLKVAVESRHPFFVEVAPGVLAVDVDDPSLAAALWILKAVLVQAGEAAVVLTSGGPGRLHLFACLGPDIDVWEKRARELRLEVRRYIRPPGTPHRAGGFSAPLDPADWSAVEQALWRPPRSRLPQDIWRSLKFGVPRGRRSQAIQSVALSMVNHGWSFHLFAAALKSTRNALSEKVLEKKPKDRESYLSHTWDKAVAFARSSPAIRTSRDANRELSRIQAAVAAAPWSTRRDKRNRRAILAILDLAYEAGGPGLSFSHRQLAERMGVAQKKTAGRALSDLQRERWLKCLKKGQGQAASDWRLLIPPSVRSYPTSTSPPGGCVASGVDRFTPGHDVFRYRGLGTVGLELVRTLDQFQGRTVTALATLIGRSWGSTKRSLVAMERVGMSRRDGEKLWYRVEVDLDSVAEILGTTGAGERQRERHQAEREGYRQYREARRQAHLALEETGLKKSMRRS